MSLYRSRSWQDGAELVLTKGGILRLRCDYDEELVERIKEEIPPGLRRWDPAEEAWFFAESLKRKVRKLVLECLNENVIVQEETA